MRTVALLCAALAWPALADTAFTVRKMVRSDVPFGQGQCDIRLQVDNEVEVAVRGDRVSVRTISGREPRDDGSECNEPLPARDLRDFNFDVKDQRGDIALIEPPGPRNGYRAIVRIRDSKGGEGRYHFRLTWSLTGGFSQPLPRGRDRSPWQDSAPPVQSNVRYSGPGAGTYQRGSDRAIRLGQARVDVDRSGGARVVFEADDGRPLAFSGNLVRTERDSLVCEMSMGAGARGLMYIGVDNRGDVYRVSMDGDAGRERFRLSWRR